MFQIIWSSSHGRKEGDEMWLPNHLVPLMEIDNGQSNIQSIQESVVPSNASPMAQTIAEPIGQQQPAIQYIPKNALSCQELFDILTSPTVNTKVRSSVPVGEKQDVHFVLLNHNEGRYEQGLPFKYPPDDIGALKTGTKVWLYRYNPSSGRINHLGALNKYKGEPLPKDVRVVIKQALSYKVSDKNYRRNVTYIVEAPDALENAKRYCIIEYLGQDKVGTSLRVHGNRLHGTTPYHKNDPSIVDGCKKDLKTMTVREVYLKYFDPRNPMKSAKSSRQISDLKRHLPENKNRPKGNLAEQMRGVLDEVMLKYPEYVRQLRFDEKKNISVYLDHDFQLEQMASLCHYDGENVIAVIEMDKTYRVGEVLHTSLAFMDANFVHEDTGTPVLQPGPILFHEKSDIDTFADWISYWKRKLDRLGCTKVFIVTDEEQAMVSALQYAYPTAVHLLCTRHLEDSVGRHISVGTSQTVKNQVLWSMFGTSNSLSSAKSRPEFDAKVGTIDQSVFEGNYFQETVDKIWTHVAGPRIDHPNAGIPINQKTNCVESYNGLTKYAIDWKPQKVQGLIEKCRTIAVGKKADRLGAIAGHGNVRLALHNQRYQVSLNKWMTSSETQQDNLLKKVYRSLDPKPTHMTSTDNTITMPLNNGIINKPGHKKTPRGNRTKSVPKSERTPNAQPKKRGRPRLNPKSPNNSKSPKAKRRMGPRFSIDEAIRLSGQDLDDYVDQTSR